MIISAIAGAYMQAIGYLIIINPRAYIESIAFKWWWANNKDYNLHICQNYSVIV